MDNIKDFLPLLIILASFIFSIVGNLKKKKKNAELERTQLPLDIPQPQRETVVKPKKEEKLISIVESIDKKRFSKSKIESFLTSDLDYQKNEDPILVEDLSDGVHTQPVLNFQDHDELKKAVIYAEILERRY